MTTLVSTESLISVLGVVYVHKKTSDGGELYLTKYGLLYADLLEIENWYEEEWFEKQAEKLTGTSAVFRVPTKEIGGRSIELVVKNCRVGEDVPLDTRTLAEFINAEFNSPWEEFSLVMEMREGRYGPKEIQIQTQEPLAIYVPPEKMQIWQSGRSKAKINRIVARHPGIDLDILRQYKMVYGWIKGQDTVRLLEDLGLKGEELDKRLVPMTKKALADMGQKGFAVADMKPDHVIIGDKEVRAISEAGACEAVDGVVRQGDYSVIDYELLLRTPAYENVVSSTRRHSYLDDQRDRFVPTEMPGHLKTVEIFGVPYIFGHAQATGGKLWVVGRNARLFDYFLPERWRKTHSWKLSARNEVFYTFTKDHVHLVWKTSRVGEKPEVGIEDPSYALVAEHGFNSPFEEFEIAQYLNEHGVDSVYPRAIYVTGTPKVEQSGDLRRYESHREIRDPNGEPILREERNYITVRGYFNGPDKWVAEQRGQLCRPIDLEKAMSAGVLGQAECLRLFRLTLERLKDVGCDGSLLEANDMLLALQPNGDLLKDREGSPAVRICNLELIRKL